jgi:hypothetical protein
MERFARAILSLATVLCIALSPIPADARGGMPAENRWNPQHIDSLPPEIRNAIARYAQVCGGSLAAEHMFATYFQKGTARLIALHFEHLRCSGGAPICSAKGCLHQVYISRGGPYRLLTSAHVPEVDLTKVPLGAER